MITIIDQKTLLKDAEKIACAADYVFINGTDKEGSKLDKFTNIVNMEGFNPPAKCLKSDKDVLDSDDKIKKAKKNWLKSKDLEKSIRAVCKTLVDSEGKLNVVIILRKKAYKRFTKAIIKKMYALTGVKGNYVKDYKNIKKKELTKPINGKELKALKKFFAKFK